MKDTSYKQVLAACRNLRQSIVVAIVKLFALSYTSISHFFVSLVRTPSLSTGHAALGVPPGGELFILPFSAHGHLLQISEPPGKIINTGILL